MALPSGRHSDGQEKLRQRPRAGQRWKQPVPRAGGRGRSCPLKSGQEGGHCREQRERGCVRREGVPERPEVRDAVSPPGWFSLLLWQGCRAGQDSSGRLAWPRTGLVPGPEAGAGPPFVPGQPRAAELKQRGPEGALLTGTEVRSWG